MAPPKATPPKKSQAAQKFAVPVCHRTPFTTYAVDVRDTLESICRRFYPTDSPRERLWRAESIVAANPQLRWVLLDGGALTLHGGSCSVSGTCSRGVHAIMNTRLMGGMDLWLPAPGSAASRPASYAPPPPLAGGEIPASEWFVFDLEDFRAQTAGLATQATSKQFAKGGVANYASSAVDSVKFVDKTLREFGWAGRAYLQRGADGRQLIVLKGTPGLRNVLRGTRYLGEHPQIVEMTIGSAGLKASAKSGAKLTFVLFAAVEVADLLTGWSNTPGFDWRDVAGTLAVDVVKVAVGATASYLAALAVQGATTAALAGGVFFVAAPVVVGIIAGVAAGYLLDKVDEKYKVTDRTVAALKAWTDHLRAEFDAAATRVGAAAENGIRSWMGAYGMGW